MSEKLIADEMNGDLAKWLRIIGYDCLYLKGGSDLDNEIIKIARRENRIVLTNDKELFRKCLRRGIKTVLTIDGRIEEKLAHVISKLNLRINGLKPRCSVCNGVLVRVESRKLMDKLSEEVVRRFRHVWLCTQCGKVYWEGSHWVKIRETIEKTRELLNYSKKHLIRGEEM